MYETENVVTINEEGSLELGDSIECFTFHPNLNVFVVTTKDSEILIFDPHTSQKLASIPQKQFLEDKDGKCTPIQCFYSPHNEGILFCAGNIVGFRRELQGTILLDTVLQTQVKDPDDTVTVELLLSEAHMLYQILHGSIPYVELKEALRNVIGEPPTQTSPKISKWQTVTLTLSWAVLRNSLSGLATDLRKFSRLIPVLPVASCLGHRVSHLYSQSDNKPIEIEKENMFSEAIRLSTFCEWPHMDYKWALPEQMAQAGFFHQPGRNNDDRAMCFICNVCLVFWEPTDEPWSEHERHSPACPFVRGEHTHNVPLAVTHAFSPAHEYLGKDCVEILSTGNSPKYIATSSGRSSITLWNVSGRLKKDCMFCVDLTDSILMDKHFVNAAGYCDIILNSDSTSELHEDTASSTKAKSVILEWMSSSETSIDSIESPVTSVPLNKVKTLSKSASLDLYVPPRGSQDIKISALCPFVAPKDMGVDKPKNMLGVGVGLRRFILSDTQLDPTKQHLSKFIPYLLIYVIPEAKEKRLTKPSTDDGPNWIKPDDGMKMSRINPICQQCIELPIDSYGLFTVQNILMTPCSKYMFVNVVNEENTVGLFAIYEVIMEDGSVVVRETPYDSVTFRESHLIPSQIVIVPQIDDYSCETMLCGIITSTGDFRVFSTATMKYMFEKKCGEEPYTNLVYCNSLEKLCVSKKTGHVTLIQVVNDDQVAEDDATFWSIMSDLCGLDAKTSCKIPKLGEIQGKDLLVNQDLCDTVLDKCIQLTQFRPGSAKFLPNITPCWLEVLLAQKQRKSPQHLQNQPHDVTSSRTWKLEPDVTTMKEHIFALSVCSSSNTASSNGGMQYGHFDVKMVFLNHQHLPKIQVTLLRPLMKSSISDPFDDNAGDLLDSNEILDGPIDATELINTADNTATVVMTSPLLLAYRGRNFLIHIKAFATDHCDVDELNFAAMQADPKAQMELKGCNVIKELSISIKTMKKAKIPHDRFQRFSMLEKQTFQEALLKEAINSTSLHIKTRSLDLFLWILTIHSSTCGPKTKEEAQIFQILLANVSELIRSTILMGDRTLAHKTTKIIVTAIDYYGRSSKKTESYKQILNALLECHDELLDCKSSGALYYYFTLLNALKHIDSENTAQKVTSFLSRIVPLLQNHYNPLHTLLQSKFKLLGLPFEREIFDCHGILGNKTTVAPINTPSNTHSHWPSNQPYHQFGLGNLPPSQKPPAVPPPTDHPEKVVMDSHPVCGLLEVEPLHFVLHKASDGTKLEKVFPGSSYGGNPLFMQPVHNTSSQTNGQQCPHEHINFYEQVTASKKLISQNPNTKDDISTATSSEYTSDGSFNEAVMEGVASDEDCEYFFPMVPNYSTFPMDASCQMLSPHMLSLPPQHVIVVDRIHAGARRFAVFDFGMPVVLTDIIIPACSELVMVTIDTWLIREETDGERLTVFPEITTKPLTLGDLQPAPVCQFLKLTLVGRHGMLNSVCKVPVGSFFGHTVILPWHLQTSNSSVSVLSKDVAMAQQPILANMVEDLSCRYSLACSKLKSLLEPFLLVPSSFHDNASNEADSDQTDKNIIQAYHECLLEQRHLNLVLSVLGRLNYYLGLEASPFSMRKSCADQLNTLVRYSLNCLLTLTVSPSESELPQSLIQWCDARQARVIIDHICLRGCRGPQVETAAAVLSRLCSSQGWWGEFLCDTLDDMFEHEYEQNFPNVRAFTLITLLGFKTCEGGYGSELVNSVVNRFLSLFGGDVASKRSSVHVPSLWWILLFLCECLEVLAPTAPASTEKLQHREPWSWMNAETLLRDDKSKEKTDQSTQVGEYRDRLCKRLSYHKQTLINLEAASKSFGEVMAGLGTWGSNPKVVKESEAAFKRLKHQHTLKHFKDLCSIQQHENNVLFRSTLNWSQKGSKNATPPTLMRLSYNSHTPFMPIERASSMKACKLLLQIILSPPPVEVDSFILICRVIGGLMIATRPCLRISEILTSEELENLLCQTIALDQTSGRPWAVHAVTCLLRGAIIEEKRRDPRDTSKHTETSDGNSSSDSDTSDDEIGAVESTKDSQDGAKFASTAVHPGTECLVDFNSYAANKFAVSSSPPPIGLATHYYDDSADYLAKNIYFDGSSEEEYKKLKKLFNPEFSDKLGKSSIWESKNGKNTSPPASKVSNVPVSYTPTYDCRLENALSLKSELNIAIYNGFHKDQQNIGLTEPLQAVNSHRQTTPEEKIYERSDLIATRELLCKVFEKAFCSLSALNDFRRLEMLMELWLHVNLTPEKPTKPPLTVPTTPLTPPTISALLAAFARCSSKSVKCWFLLFQLLGCCCHTTVSNWSTIPYCKSYQEPMIAYVIKDSNLQKVLDKFLNGDYSMLGRRLEGRTDMAGVSLTKSFSFLLENCILQAKRHLKDTVQWKSVCLNILIDLLKEDGAFSSGYGPLAAQETFLRSLRQLKLHEMKDHGIALKIVKGIGLAIYNYASSIYEPATPNQDSSTLLGGLFASVLGSEGRQGPPITREVVICWLINTAGLILNVHKDVCAKENESSENTVDTEEMEFVKDVKNDGPGTSEDTELIDFVVRDEATMDLYLQALSKLNGTSILFALKGLPLEIPDQLGLTGSPIEDLHRLLVQMHIKTHAMKEFLSSILRVLQPAGPWFLVNLSEGLFCFLAQILEQPNILKQWTELGGFKVLWSNLIQSASQIGAGQISNDQRGLVSAVMTHLNPQLPSTAPVSVTPRRMDSDDVLSANTARQRSEIDAVSRGLYNFAPIANITSSNHTSRPADALVTNAPFFQRNKNPQWSYHFYPNEKWVDLKLTLPCAILLHEVHLQPHTMALGSSPGAVSVETSLDGHVYYPATRQIVMAGLTYLKIEFPLPIVTCAVRIRLGHPLEQTTLGLSQIRMYGTTALKSLPIQASDTNKETPSYKASVWWLRLIEHCLCNIDGGLQLGVTCAKEMKDIIPSLVSLITASTSSLSLGSTSANPTESPLESIALALCKASSVLLTELITGLLDQPLFVHSLGTSTVDAPISLLYSICTEHSTVGLELMLKWLHKCSQSFDNDSGEPSKQTYVTPILLRCIAAALWNTKADVAPLLSLELFKDISTWRDLSLGTLNSGLNQILCSMCKIKPIFFVKTLCYMGILAEDKSPDPQSTQSKENKFGFPTCCTDDTKESIDISPDLHIPNLYLSDAHSIPLNGTLLHNLGAVCKSYEAANLLLDSGFLNLLVQGILAWCKKELITGMEEGESETVTSAPCMDTALVADTIEAFNVFASQLPLKEWLGCGEGSAFWLPLLTVLGDPTVRSLSIGETKNALSYNMSWDYIRLEDATLKLMRECVLFHLENQKILASTLCHLIQKQKVPPSGGMTYLHSLSGFTRRLVLQVLLEVEYVTVHVSATEGALSVTPSTCSSACLPHPQDGIGQRSRVLNLPASTTVEQVLKLVTAKSGARGTHESKSSDEQLNSELNGFQKKGLGKVGLEIVQKLYVAAGVSAKDKRHKHKLFRLKVPKNDGESSSEVKKTENPKGTGTYGLCHPGLLCGRCALPPNMTLSEILSALRDAVPSSKVTPRLRFILLPRSKLVKVEKEEVDKLFKSERFPSTLETFTSLGGLSLLAQHMALLYPDTSCQLIDSPIPPHSLGAFTLFLRLPGYAQSLLINLKNACALLKLAFGANNIAETGPPNSKNPPLATLPFQVLESLLSSTPHSTDDGRVLRKMCLKTGALHLILACLAALSHQDTPEVIATLHHPNVPIGLVVAATRSSAIGPTENGPPTTAKPDPERCYYWAKGTGFGTGSTNQNWNVEHSIQRQQMEEQHIVWLLRLLAQYIHPVPADTTTEDCLEVKNENALPDDVFNLFRDSGLISKIASYLSNDSVLDMSRHVPLYKALMDLIVAIGVTSSINDLLVQPLNDGKPNLPNLLASMMKNGETYISKLSVKPKTVKTTAADTKEQQDDNEEEGLSFLVPYMRQAARLVEKLNEKVNQKNGSGENTSLESLLSETGPEAYEKVMKLLQFDSYEMLIENTETNELMFTVPYNYESGAKNMLSATFSNKRLKRLAQEVVTLSTSLPLSHSSSVFVRTDVDRIDIMKVLITGPEDTPYANGCFEFDVFFPPDYPQSPLSINLQTTGEKKVRFNPNLYQDGKVCLSILNTWHGRPEEKWSSHTSSLLQVLVSIQSLILVPEPYFNEPGYEKSRGTPVGISKSQEYDANIRIATVRYAILNQLKTPSPCFKEIIERHFWMKRMIVCKQIDDWIAEMDTEVANGSNAKNLLTHLASLKKLKTLVDEELKKIDPYKGSCDKSSKTPDDIKPKRRRYDTAPPPKTKFTPNSNFTEYFPTPVLKTFSSEEEDDGLSYLGSYDFDKLMLSSFNNDDFDADGFE